MTFAFNTKQVQYDPQNRSPRLRLTDVGDSAKSMSPTSILWYKKRGAQCAPSAPLSGKGERQGCQRPVPSPTANRFSPITTNKC
ncbi:MAG: hypothetical protein K2H04_10840 [Bacteroidaceae bacterium]|nr:hypothetical protein [Bacteroidaceae bacterium]